MRTTAFAIRSSLGAVDTNRSCFDLRRASPVSKKRFKCQEIILMKYFPVFANQFGQIDMFPLQLVNKLKFCRISERTEEFPSHTLVKVGSGFLENNKKKCLQYLCTLIDTINNYVRQYFQFKTFFYK